MGNGQTQSWRAKGVETLMQQIAQRFGLSADDVSFGFTREWEDKLVELDELEQAAKQMRADDAEHAHYAKMQFGTKMGGLEAEQAEAVLKEELSQPLLDDEVKRYGVSIEMHDPKRSLGFLNELHARLGDEFYHAKASDGELDIAKLSSDDFHQLYNALKKVRDNLPVRGDELGR